MLLPFFIIKILKNIFRCRFLRCVDLFQYVPQSVLKSKTPALANVYGIPQILKV